VVVMFEPRGGRRRMDAPLLPEGGRDEGENGFIKKKIPPFILWKSHPLSPFPLLSFGCD